MRRRSGVCPDPHAREWKGDLNFELEVGERVFTIDANSDSKSVSKEKVATECLSLLIENEK